MAIKKETDAKSKIKVAVKEIAEKAADKVKKVQRVMEVDCIGEEKAKKRIRKIDRERKEYYKYFTGNEWHNIKNYDLPINTTRLNLDETAELIKTYIKLRGFME